MIFETKITEAKAAVEAALAALNAAYDHTPDLRTHEQLDALRGRMLDIARDVHIIDDQDEADEVELARLDAADRGDFDDQDDDGDSARQRGREEAAAAYREEF